MTSNPENPKIQFVLEPRRMDEFHYLGTKYMINTVAHHGGTREYTVYATTGGYGQEFTVECLSA